MADAPEPPELPDEETRRREVEERVIRLAHLRPWRLEPIEHQRERTRSRLALVTVLLFGGTVAMAILMVAINAATAEEMKELLQPIIPAEAGLAGAAVAFYFGGRSET